MGIVLKCSNDAGYHSGLGGKGEDKNRQGLWREGGL